MVILFTISLYNQKFKFMFVFGLIVGVLAGVAGTLIYQNNKTKVLKETLAGAQAELDKLKGK